MKIGEPYLRKHRSNWIVEQKIDGKTNHLCTTNAIEILNLKGVQFDEGKAYRSTRKKKKKGSQKFAQVLLSEPKGKEKEDNWVDDKLMLKEIFLKDIGI